MEVYEASEYFIVHEGDHSLWCNRTTGIIEAKPGMIVVFVGLKTYSQ